MLQLKPETIKNNDITIRNAGNGEGERIEKGEYGIKVFNVTNTNEDG